MCPTSPSTWASQGNSSTLVRPSTPPASRKKHRVTLLLPPDAWIMFFNLLCLSSLVSLPRPHSPTPPSFISSFLSPTPFHPCLFFVYVLFISSRFPIYSSLLVLLPTSPSSPPPPSPSLPLPPTPPPPLSLAASRFRVPPQDRTRRTWETTCCSPTSRSSGGSRTCGATCSRTSSTTSRCWRSRCC